MTHASRTETVIEHIYDALEVAESKEARTVTLSVEELRILLDEVDRLYDCVDDAELSREEEDTAA